MNTITLLIIAACLFQGISCARRCTATSSQSKNDKPPLDRSWVPPEFDYVPDDVIREIIRQYKEINNRPPQKPLPPPFSPPNTDDIMPNVKPKIFNYELGKTAVITPTGELRIDDRYVYSELPELRPGHGYSILVQDGILSVNSKVVFKNDPRSKVKIPWNHAKFSINDTMSLRMTVMADGTLRCFDDQSKVIKLTPIPSPTLTKDNELSIATGYKNAPVQPVTPNKGLAPNNDQKIFSYRPGKTALITAVGTLKIDGEIIYKNLSELKKKAGYSIREQDGTLSVNGIAVFKNDPQFHFKIPRNVATNFKSDTNWLKITVLDDGTLKCVDNKNKVRKFS